MKNDVNPLGGWNGRRSRNNRDSRARFSGISDVYVKNEDPFLSFNILGKINFTGFADRKLNILAAMFSLPTRRKKVIIMLSFREFILSVAFTINDNVDTPNTFEIKCRNWTKMVVRNEFRFVYLVMPITLQRVCLSSTPIFNQLQSELNVYKVITVFRELKVTEPQGPFVKLVIAFSWRFTFNGLWKCMLALQVKFLQSNYKFQFPTTEKNKMKIPIPIIFSLGWRNLIISFLPSLFL